MKSSLVDEFEREVIVNFVLVDSRVIRERLISCFDAKLKYHYNLLKNEIDSDVGRIDVKLVNLSKVLQNPQIFGEEKDMVLVSKLNNDHVVCKQVLSKITEQFRRLSLIKLDENEDSNDYSRVVYI